MRQCKVFVHDVEAGVLQETDDRQYIFTYLKGYAGAPVCIAMPVRTEPEDHGVGSSDHFVNF